MAAFLVAPLRGLQMVPSSTVISPRVDLGPVDSASDPASAFSERARVFAMFSASFLSGVPPSL